MPPFPFYHLIVYAPVTHAQLVRDALAEAGAGRIGHYDSCSFSMHGTGRFRPLKGAKPAMGTTGKLEEVEEERIEVVIPSASKRKVREILDAVKNAHPYEEPAIHLLPMMDGG
ncbi:hypothetical protein HY285_04355 [Candidatus Peregrinibacteria bacterium]|nr:hypothetical protein [Candidatus Peregrinibacteria bacterium]MBI3816745.1 hypothetical protein [Candidatus Peregrinibacteria bacterium]